MFSWLAAFQGDCGPSHLELDWVNARLMYNNLGGHGKVSADPPVIRYQNVGTLGGRQVDVVFSSRECARPAPPFPQRRNARDTAHAPHMNIACRG